MKKSLFLVAWVISITLSLPLHAANLMEIYREALEHDAQYGSARAAYIAAQEKLPQGRAGLLPTINATGTAQNQYIDTNLGSEVLIRNRGVVIAATQPLFRIENFIIYEQSKNQVAQADARFVLAAQDLIIRVAQAYFNALIAQSNLEVVETQKKAIQQQLEQAKRNFEVGVSTIVDTHEAQARYDLTLSQEIAARNALEISKRTLQGIINRFPDSLVRISIDKIITDKLDLAHDNMEEWVNIAEQKNFSLRVQQIAFDLAEQEISKAKAGH
ncbi:MAG TPA: TolC family protein, partial [Nitrosomonas sp.]|nr:TolC family protein [Nitrosomonas sp.]